LGRRVDLVVSALPADDSHYSGNIGAVALGKSSGVQCNPVHESRPRTAPIIRRRWPCSA